MHFLEVGNTTFKLALRRTDGDFRIVRYNSAAALAEGLVDVAELVIAPVAERRTADVVGAFPGSLRYRLLQRDNFVGFVGDTYDTPESLGLDRILNLYGVPTDGVVVSCGTAITVDAVVSGTPAWGAIMPGFNTLLQGLTDRIPVLPTVDVSDLRGLPARSTRNSVANGTILATAYGAGELALRLSTALGIPSSIPVTLTGGDAGLMSRLWPGDSETQIRSDLLFRGMERGHRQSLSR